VTQHVYLVGPVFPLPGGIAQHNARLATELEARGFHVVVESWSHQYPKSLYRGEAQVPSSKPEVDQPSIVLRELKWFSPWSWWRAGTRAKSADLLVFTIPTPFHAIPYWLLTRALSPACFVVGIAHNPKPHETSPFDRALSRVLASLCDRIVVHNDEGRAELEDSVGKETPISVVSLPSPWSPLNTRRKSKGRGANLRALFVGTVRPYKGLDLLLEALALAPGIELVVAGDFWEPIEKYRQLVTRLGLNSRVTLKPGYVPQEEFADLFDNADVLVLPYRSGSGSILRELAFDHGVPVIATNVGSIAETIVDGQNGYVIDSATPGNISAALHRASGPGVWDQLVEEVVRLRRDNDALWDEYCNVVTNID
jgi:glycosyltransferase involved in cell wall biosynthesis